jgi:hypothetical protein
VSEQAPAVSTTAEPAADTGSAVATEGHLDHSAAIYGSLLVTALVAAESRFGSTIEFLALSVVVSALVFYLMEAWSELVNVRVRGPIDLAETRHVAVRESPMVLAAIIPSIVLIAPRLGLLGVDQAIALALAVCVVQLFLWGLAVGHAISRGWAVALRVAVVDCVLGLLIVALKVWVIH